MRGEVKYELFARFTDLVRQLTAIRPIPRPDPQRRLKAELGLPAVGEEGQGVRGPRRPRNEQPGIGLVEALLVVEREPGRPRDRRRDVHGRRGEGDIREALRDETVPDVLPSSAADVERSPVEALREVQARPETRRGEIRIHRVVLDYGDVARVVDVRVEVGARREALLMLPSE